MPPPEQSPSVFPSRRLSHHLQSETVRTLARILSLFSDESQCSPAIQISPKLGLETQQELCNDSIDPGGFIPENFSIASSKAVGIHNESTSSSPERILKNQLDDDRRTRLEEGYEYLGFRRQVCIPSNVSVEKDLIANDGVDSINDHYKHLVSEEIVLKKSGKGTSELEQIVTKESDYGTRLERNEEDLVADIVVVVSASSGIQFNNSLLEQNDVVEVGNVTGQVEFKGNFDLSIKSSEEFDVQDGAFTPKPIVTVGFGHKMGLEGNEDLTFGDILKDTHIISLKKDQVANDVGASINNYNSDILCSERIDVEALPQVPEVIESEPLKSKTMLENELIPKESMSVNIAKDGASLGCMMKKLEHEMRWNELNSKESASNKVIPDFSVSFVSDREIEDGEILDAVLESKGVEGQIFEDFMKKEKFSDKCKEHKREYEDCVPAELNGRKRKGKEARSGTLVRNVKKKGNGPKEDINCPIAPPKGAQLHEEISDKNVTPTRPMTSKEKDVKVCDKKKRGPLTENRKMKKKLKKRRERAEKNKLLGVKRLKLQPVLKPKPVTYCKHYLQGRCRQGDLCKFSHDTIPLTKSTPCKHFARHLCLKGDECPFDHELSKYPCDNYVSKGSCIRGDKCLFSHKVLPKEGTSTSLNAGKPELESALLVNKNSRKEVNIDSRSCCTVEDFSKHKAVRVPLSMGAIPHSKPDENVVGKRLKPLGQVPRGMRFLVNGNTTLDDSNRKQHGDLPSNGGNGMVMCNQKRKNAPETHQDLNAMQWRASPAVPPKGISFLSMGKVALSDPSKQQGGGFPPKQDRVEICNSKNQSVSDKLQNPIETALRMSKPPVSIGHSITPLVDGNDSSQKTLSSTLAFAAKYESEKGLGHSTCPLAFCAEVSKASRNNSYLSTGNSQNEPMKASKILEEFLFGAGGSANQ